MSEMEQVLRLLQEFRTEVREDFREVKQKQDRTNGRVNDHERRITIIETRGEDDRIGKKRWKDWVPQVVTMLISSGLSLLLYAVVFAH